MPAAVPHGTDRMNDMPRAELIAFCDLGSARGATIELAALLEKLRTGSAMNGAVHAATSQQRGVSRVDDGIHRLLGNVPFNKFKTIDHGNTLCCGKRLPASSVMSKIECTRVQHFGEDFQRLNQARTGAIE